MMLEIDLSPIYQYVSWGVAVLMPFIVAVILVKKSLY
jgi:hypothetical protein